MDFLHLTVLEEEAVALLAPQPGGTYVDGTVGGGGHSSAILAASAPDGRLFGFDRDEEALAAAAEVLQKFGGRVTLIHDNFCEMAPRLAEAGVTGIDGFILDLGVSSHQLDSAERGFSFREDAPLDMRMDRSSGESAEELIARVDTEELERIIRTYGEERWARRVARTIVREREKSPVDSTLRLAGIVAAAVPKSREERIHPATRTFQAIRIAVNDELGSLERGLESAISLLNPGGRGVVISFHSLEDRIVKNAFRDAAHGCVCPRDFPFCRCGKTPTAKVLTPKGVTAGEAELQRNPRARSARLRAVQKL